MPSLRTTLAYQIESSNSGGIQSITVPDAANPVAIPDCTPQATISLRPINSACSAGKPQNYLTWTSSDGSAGSLANFTILRDGTQIGTTNKDIYIDTTAESGIDYAYSVQSDATVSNVQSLTSASCPQPPSPFTLTATPKCSTLIPVNTLAWTTSSNALRYEVRRDNQTQPIATIDAPLTSYDDSSIATGINYKYSITAINSVGIRISNEEQITAANCAPKPVNGPPVANDDSAITGPATLVNVLVLANDSDPDNDINPTTLKVTQQPANGTTTVNPAGGVDYTPKAGFSGADTFTYEICDKTALCDSAVVTISVSATPPPAPVLPGPITLSTNSICAGSNTQHVLTWSASTNALRYLVKRNGQILTTITPVSPSNTPATSFVDASPVAGNSYSYTIEAQNNDGVATSNGTSITTANCATPTPTPTPTPVNQPPQANDDTATTKQGTPVSINVLANDIDPEGHINPGCTTVTTQPAHGTTTINLVNGIVLYAPATGFSGTDSFTYEMCDAAGLKDTAIVTITVQAPAPTPQPTNTPPQANDDAATTPHAAPVTIDILANDKDPDNNLDPTCVKITKQPEHGAIVINAQNGRATYTPAVDFFGTDTFKYTVCDTAKAVSNEATVSIAVNQAPPATLVSTGIPIFGFLVDLWNRFLTFVGLR